jgi:16S rRNA (guanine(1405)-N(7))-methyltransferase
VSHEILGLHSSTAERLPFLAELYGRLLGDGLQSGSRVLDLGCGLDPFALPWMALPRGAEYHAVDMDERLARSIGRYLALLGRPGSAAAGDILGGAIPPGRWDVVLLMKLLPTLERQQRGSAARLLRSLDAARIVVSFPRASLGGRRKGMDGQYESLMDRILEGSGLALERLAWESESVYVCTRRRGG